MKKYGFFGGSFNPVTNAHIELARDIVEKYDLDKVIFVPVGDCYNKPNLISEKHRYNMIKCAIEKIDELTVSDIELNQTRNLTTLEAFNKIEDAYEGIEKFYIIGADNLKKLELSKDIDNLARDFKYIVIERGEFDCNKMIAENEKLNEYKENFFIMDNLKHVASSATKVRENIEFYKNFISKEVYEYIVKNGLYL